MNGIMCRYFTRAGKAPFAEILLPEACVIEEDTLEIDGKDYEIVHVKFHFKTTDDNPQMYCDSIVKAIESHDDPTYPTEEEEDRNLLLGQVWVIAHDDTRELLHHFHDDNGNQTYKFMNINLAIMGKVRNLVTFRDQTDALEHSVLLKQLGKLDLTKKIRPRKIHLVLEQS